MDCEGWLALIQRGRSQQVMNPSYHAVRLSIENRLKLTDELSLSLSLSLGYSALCPISNGISTWQLLLIWHPSFSEFIPSPPFHHPHPYLFTSLLNSFCFRLFPCSPCSLKCRRCMSIVLCGMTEKLAKRGLDSTYTSVIQIHMPKFCSAQCWNG